MAVINITRENFAQEVLHSEKPVLLDFWASWCGPCRMLSPVVDEVAEERTDVKVGKVNVDEQPDLAAQFGVMSIYKCNHKTKAKEKQKIQHNFHPSGRTCTEGHGMNDKKIDLTPAAIIACLFKAVPDLQR